MARRLSNALWMVVGFMLVGLGAEIAVYVLITVGYWLFR